MCFVAPPGKPGQPEVIKVGKYYCDLRWAPPKSDGGSRISGYDVEVREYPDGTWVSKSALVATLWLRSTSPVTLIF